MTISNPNIREIGDNLETLAAKAKLWFEKNSIPVPNGAKAWSKCSERRDEIPTGCSVNAIRRYGYNLTEFISQITGSDKHKYNYDPLTKENLHINLGLNWISSRLVNGHKRIHTSCCNCSREEVLDYGTLQRMRASGNKYCRYCRNAGGKAKDVSIYDKFEGFSIVSERAEDSRVRYKCASCSSIIERTLTHVSTTEYLVCEHCNPRENFEARLHTEHGYFDSKIEYHAYLILLEYFDIDDIIRQKPYDSLFNTRTKHTADFFIKSCNLVLEVTSASNNIGAKYKETASWKMSLSESVKFAYSLKEVEDIVRPLSKVSGLTVDHSRSLLRRCTVW